MQTAALAALARCVNAEVYVLQRQGDALEALCKALADQVPRHSTAEPLLESLHSLAHLVSQDHAVQVSAGRSGLIQGARASSSPRRASATNGQSFAL